MSNTDAEVLERAQQIYAENNAITMATTGGRYSPWVLGAYFVHDGADVYLMVEKTGKTIENLRANARVAFSVSQNDAMKDFLQGVADAVILSDDEYDAVMARLKGKMPWYQLYTPCAPVRLETRELFVSSLSSGWFPAKRVAVRG